MTHFPKGNLRFLILFSEILWDRKPSEVNHPNFHHLGKLTGAQSGNDLSKVIQPAGNLIMEEV